MLQNKITEARCCIGCLKDEKIVGIEENIDSKISEMYKTLVNVEITLLKTETGLLKITLCNICTKKLKLIVDFQEQCLKSISSLKSKLISNTEIVSVKMEPIEYCDVIVKEEYVMEEQKFGFTSKIKDDDDDTSTMQNDEIVSDASDIFEVPKKKIRDRIPCKKCEKTFLNRNSLKRHIQIIHLNGKICRYCQRIFIDKEEYSKHMEEEETKTRPDTTVFCDQCSFSTKFKQSLVKHFQKYHSLDQKSMICDVCGKTYKLRNDFKQHFMSCHMEKQFLCNLCGKKFGLNSELRNHQRCLHEMENCHLCGKMMTKGSISQHIKAVHLQIRRIYKRKKRNRRVRSFREKPKKVKNETEEKPIRRYKKRKTKVKSNEDTIIEMVQCDICDQMFKKSYIKNHIKYVHQKLKKGSNAPNFPCTHCGEICKTKFRLKQHFITTHIDKETLKRDYVKCKYCDLMFTPGTEHQHELSHLKRFKCDECDKGFSTANNLVIHKHSHRGTRPLSCYICEKGFFRNMPLREHFRKKHNVEYTEEQFQTYVVNNRQENLQKKL